MARPKIVLDLADGLVADLFAPDQLARLAGLGDVVRTNGDGSGRKGAEILITGWGTAPIANGDVDDGLRLVVHSAGTIRKLVSKDALASGIRVSHASAGMARSVAELALSFTMSMLRNLHTVDRLMSVDHDWDAAQSLGFGRTIASARIGVVGASRVGRSYIAMAVALGAAVTVYDPYLSREAAEGLGVATASLDELIGSSDVLALHAPVTDETIHFIDSKRLAALRDGAILVNTARSRLLDMDALVRELASGRISAALDVFDEEPLPENSVLWTLPNVILTPHIGAVTLESRHEQGAIVIDEIERYLEGRPLVNEVLPETYDRLA